MEQVKRVNIRMAAALLMLGVYLFITRYALREYILWDSPGFLLGLAAIPLVLTANPQQKRSLRFYYAALACCILAWLLPAKTLLYGCVALALCFLADNIFGKINALPLLALGLMAPVCDYMTRIFTFPIRLQLTQWAAGMLHALGLPAVAEGNVIMYQGATFSVEAACMGLGMMVTSMLCGLMLLGIYQKKYGLVVPFAKVCMLLAGIFALNVISNLFRILLLVVLHLLPGDPLHEATGILCLAAYVLLPLLWFCPWLVKRFGKPLETKPARKESDRFMLTLSHLCLAGCIALVAYKTTLPAAGTTAAAGLPSMPGYTLQVLPNHVTKAENDTALVYLKPVGGFYRTDHHPTICWQGSGFDFKQVKEEQAGGSAIYTAILQKGHERLYTAWWYDNGRHQTISQWEWRWKALRYGNDYTLVNVTAATPAALHAETLRWLGKNKTGGMGKM